MERRRVEVMRSTDRQREERKTVWRTGGRREEKRRRVERRNPPAPRLTLISKWMIILNPSVDAVSSAAP